MTSATFTLGGAEPLRRLVKKLCGGLNFTLGALHPETPLAEKLSFPKTALDPI